MRKLARMPVAVALMACAGSAFADADMLRKNNCIACHHNERKMVGPAYRDIAAKYAGVSGSAEKLAKKIQAGGAGVWGEMPMPPHPQLSDADALTLAKYVLTIK